MFKNLDKKNILFQLSIGVLAYLMFFQTVAKKVPKIVVGDALGEGSIYEPKYFKDSEYFQNFEKPEKYLNNYYKLIRFLDSVRAGFGLPIIISRGYYPSETGLITDLFQTCQSVEFYSQNGKHSELFNLVKNMVSVNSKIVSEVVQLPNNKIKITVNV